MAGTSEALAEDTTGDEESSHAASEVAADADAPFDLNTASAPELHARFPDLGRRLAFWVVRHRGRVGPFTDEASVAAVKGMAPEWATRLAATLGGRDASSGLFPVAAKDGLEAEAQAQTADAGEPPTEDQWGEAPGAAEAPAPEEGGGEAEHEEPAAKADDWGDGETAAKADDWGDDSPATETAAKADDWGDDSPATETAAKADDWGGDDSPATETAAKADDWGGDDSPAPTPPSERATPPAIPPPLAAALPPAIPHAPPAAEGHEATAASVAPDAGATAVTAVTAVTQPDPRFERKRTLKLAALSVVVSLVAAGVAAGIAVKVEGKRSRAPVAEIASEVATLKAEHQTMKDTLAKTRADVEKQTEKIKEAAQKSTTVARRQDELEDKHKVAEVRLGDLEKSQKDLESRQARMNMVMSSKIAGVENRLGERVTSLTKALELIDFVNGGPPRAASGAGPATPSAANATGAAPAAAAKVDAAKPAPAKAGDKPKAAAPPPDAHGGHGGHGGHHAL